MYHWQRRSAPSQNQALIADGRFALVKTTLLDYPGRVAAAVFLPGCPLRCPYCHNPGFVNLNRLSEPLNADMSLLKNFLAKRARLLGGIVYSGGEALTHPLLPELMETAEHFSLPVKLDTAGLYPEALYTLLKDNKLSYVAVDLKTSPERYSEVGWKKSGENAALALRSTLEMLRNFKVDFEVRTTVVPGLVEKEELQKLSGLAELAPLWVLQNYLPGDTLNPAWGNLTPFGEGKLRELADSISAHVPITVR